MLIARRQVLKCLTGLVAAPAVIREASLMPVKVVLEIPISREIIMVPRSMGAATVNLATIKDLLLPGLRGVAGRYEMFPTQFDRIFRNGIS